MNVEQHIKELINNQTGNKQNEMKELHKLILQIMPGCKLWYFDGKDDKGKTVANPTIGYGVQNIKYKDGSIKEFFQIGLLANTTGISVHILGIEDKAYLAKTYGKNIGKAGITGYCIKFKTLRDINVDVLKDAILFGINNTSVKLIP